MIPQFRKDLIQMINDSKLPTIDIILILFDVLGLCINALKIERGYSRDYHTDLFN